MNERPSGLINDFLDAIAAERSAAPNTIESYRRDLSAYVEFLARREKTPIAASDADVRAFQADGGAQGFANSTLARRLSAVRQFHKHLYLDGQRGDDPTIALEGPRRARPLPKVLTVAEVERLIATACEGADAPERTPKERLATVRMGCLIELVYATGLRVSELIALPKSAARAKDPLITVVGKGNKERLAPLSEPAREAMRRYRSLLEELFPVRAKKSVVVSGRQRKRPPLSPGFCSRFEDSGGRCGHYGQARQPARAAPCVRQPLVARRRGLARSPGPARPRRHIHDADLYPRARRARQGDGARSAPTGRRSGLSILTKNERELDNSHES